MAGEIGVVIGRFQVASLHEGHVALLSAVASRSSRLVVLVGCSPAVVGRRRISNERMASRATMLR